MVGAVQKWSEVPQGCVKGLGLECAPVSVGCDKTAAQSLWLKPQAALASDRGYMRRSAAGRCSVLAPRTRTDGAVTCQSQSKVKENAFASKPGLQPATSNHSHEHTPPCCRAGGLTHSLDALSWLEMGPELAGEGEKGFPQGWETPFLPGRFQNSEEKRSDEHRAGELGFFFLDAGAEVESLEMAANLQRGGLKGWEKAGNGRKGNFP